MTDALETPAESEEVEVQFDDSDFVTMRPQSVRRRRILMIIGILAFLALVVLFFAYNWFNNQIDPDGPPGEIVEVAVPLESTPGEIAALLADNQVIPNAFMFQMWSKYRSFDDFQAGTYQFQTNMSGDEAISILREGPVPLNIVTVQIIEGETIDEFIPRIADLLPEVTEADFRAALEDPNITASFRPEGVTSWEGLLFPDTYELFENSTAEDVIAKLHDQMVSVAQRNGLGAADTEREFGLSKYEILILASMIEAEAQVDEDFSKISAVMHNRIDDQVWLDIDATLVYSTGRREITDADLANANDPYNTSSRAGAVTRGRIPPTPIGAPSARAIQAALNPADGDWLFYVLDEALDGSHYFSLTLDEHNRAVARWRAAEARNG